MGDKAQAGSSNSQGGSLASPSQAPISIYLQKLRQGDAATWEKDELLTVIYWWRQLSGIPIGLLLGFMDVTGMIGFTTFFVITLAVTAGIYKSLLGIDEEDYGGHTELIWEGVPSSFASFLVAWILTYTALHS